MNITERATRRVDDTTRDGLRLHAHAGRLKESQATGRIVELDLHALESAGHLVPAHGRSALSEQFRHIKRPLLKNLRSAEASQHPMSLIMVTSALPGEGKTFCALNLAMSLAAEIDTSVLLVDADVIRRDLMRRLGVDAPLGLMDLLIDPALPVADVVLETNVPKLSLLSAGTPQAMSTELLASEAMESLLASLSGGDHERVVIFDTPPLLAATEARVLASMLGQILMVVQAWKTPRSVLMQAFAAIEQCPVVMSVLNKAAKAEAGYGAYYG